MSGETFAIVLRVELVDELGDAASGEFIAAIELAGINGDVPHFDIRNRESDAAIATVPVDVVERAVTTLKLELGHAIGEKDDDA